MNSNIILPFNDIDISNWYWYNRGFSNQEIDKIISKANLQNFENATTDSLNSENVRKSMITWLKPDDEENNWLFEKLKAMILNANKSLWNFDISYLLEPLQFTEYHGDGGHYDYHLDVGLNVNHRKISVIVQLEDSSNYEGGDLQILRNKEPESLPRDKGAVILFPSFLLHRVTPVTSGIRRSLVCWAGSSQFR